MRTLISGGIVIASGEAKELNILIEGEKIAGLVSCGDSVSADQIIDASGQFILPGAINGHTHFEVSPKRFIVTFFTHYSLPFMFAFVCRQRFWEKRLFSTRETFQPFVIIHQQVVYCSASKVVGQNQGKNNGDFLAANELKE